MSVHWKRAKLERMRGCKECEETCAFNGLVASKEVAQASARAYPCHNISKMIEGLKEVA